MNMNDKLVNVFNETFGNPKFEIDDFDDLELNSIPEWDSLGNLNFLMNIESNFSIRFSSEQLAELKSIKEILNFLEQN